MSTELEKEYFKNLIIFLNEEYSSKKIYPPKELIFNLFNHIKFSNIKVVILGQDPYHGDGQGNGIAFSVNPGVKIPPSLNNIYKEIAAEYKKIGISLNPPHSGDLTNWVEQGVFLLNTTLTVREGQPASHAKKGWEIFTDKVLQLINEKSTPVVFILWGDHARKKKFLITNPIHLILESAHPSPLSAYRGFFGCDHFLKCNEFLRENGEREICWESGNKKRLIPKTLW